MIKFHDQISQLGMEQGKYLMVRLSVPVSKSISTLNETFMNACEDIFFDDLDNIVHLSLPTVLRSE